MFHRLNVPTYYGGLPGGYDYINNALVGTPAPAGSVKSGGPNDGTYFVAFGEDATSSAANRPAQALAENCDYLDNLLRRDIAAPTRTSNVTSAGESSIMLTGPGIYLGPSGTPNTVAGIETIFQLVDSNDNEIVNTGVEVKVASITGGVVGSNDFSAGNVTLTLTAAIPNGVIYRVYYGVRSSLATLPVDAFTNIKIRGAQEVPGELLGYGGSALVGSAATATSFSGAPLTLSAGTVYAQVQGLQDFINNAFRVRTVSLASFTIDSGGVYDKIILFNTTSNSIAVSLPNPASNKGRSFLLLDSSGTLSVTRTITLVRYSTETIQGLAQNYVLQAPWGRWWLISDGSNWYIASM